MNNLNLVLFDLDGTLTDPCLGITNSVMYALKKFGYPVPEREKLHFFIGPPLVDSFIKLLGVDQKRAEELVSAYREHFSKVGLFENEVISGAKELLSSLKAKGITIVLATSKPKIFADKILEHFSLSKYFDETVGSFLDGRLTNKGEVIAEVLKLYPNTPKTNTVMVGDRCYDILGALENGITPIGVLCGYGDKAELQNAGAALIFNDLFALRDYLLK